MFEWKEKKVRIKKMGLERDHRKSYGLEFIDIRKEIERELKTLEI